MHAATSRARRLMPCALALAALAAAGCGYARHRGQDALDMFDLGFTLTRKPQFGLYANCPMLAPAGYGKVDGEFVGLGDGKVGVMEHHQDNVGLLVTGREKTTWGKTKDEHDGTEDNAVAPAGFVTDAADRDAGYDPACVHYLHLGWVGVTGNIHYAEIPDFLLGWSGFDLMADDGRPRGAPRPEAAGAAPRAPALAAARPRTSFCLGCGGRRFADRWPPAPGDVGPNGRSATESSFVGRWCTCWSTEPRPATAP